jgi:hypothetical protein
MSTKTKEKGTTKVKTLRVQGLTAEKSKQIKGGPCPGTNTRALRLS